MAGSVVDGMLAGVAGAATGVAKGKPKMGGTLTVGLLSDVPNYHIFNGSSGKLDASGFCVANALYDPLFVTSHDGKSWLPMLALSAKSSSNYTVWTIALRHGVQFHDGTNFDASVVVANYNAAAANATVGLAIQPIIASVKEINSYTVEYTTVIPFARFPILLSEQQIAYMAAPSALGNTYAGKPIGTGPFKFKSWSVGVESQFTKNPKYWRKDGAGRRLPYLDGHQLQDHRRPPVAQRGPAVGFGGHDPPGEWRPDHPTEEDVGGLNRLELDRAHRPADQLPDREHDRHAQPVLLLGGRVRLHRRSRGPAVHREGRGRTNHGARRRLAGHPWARSIRQRLQWDTSLKPVMNNLSIRQACAMAINRATYFKVIDGGVGAVADGLYRKSSPFYTSPNYPAYNPTKAKALVDAYKSQNNLTTVGFVIDILQDDASAQQAYSFFESQLSAIGITTTPRPLVQSTLINNVIYGEYDCATWNQFGGVDPALNYVWFVSLSATGSPAAGGLGLTSLPAGTNIAGAVNFAHQADPVVEGAMLSALGSAPGSAAEIRGWRTVNDQFAKDIPYLWLDQSARRVGRQEPRAELGLRYGGRRHDALSQPGRRFGALGPDLALVVTRA